MAKLESISTGFNTPSRTVVRLKNVGGQQNPQDYEKQKTLKDYGATGTILRSARYGDLYVRDLSQRKFLRPQKALQGTQPREPTPIPRLCADRGTR